MMDEQTLVHGVQHALETWAIHTEMGVMQPDGCSCEHAGMLSCDGDVQP